MTTDVGEGEERGGVTVYTVGHSNRDLDEFVGLLKAHGVDTLVDIRKLPGGGCRQQTTKTRFQLSLAGPPFVILRRRRA